jgi:glycosyltransferase involved in cell wall biosynthesis
VIVTSYITGAPNGKNLGCPGYSYDFVVRLFAPLLERWGELVVVPREEVDHAVDEARRRRLEPIHLSFLPLHDIRLAANAPNIAVPAWEFPDVPDHAFDNKAENNWVEMAARCDLLIVGGPFTVNAFRRAAVRTPIQIVPVPTADDYFHVPPWDPGQRTRLDFSAYSFSQPSPEPAIVEEQAGPPAPCAVSWRRRAARFLVRAAGAIYRRGIRRVASERLHFALKTAVYFGHCAWRDPNLFSPPAMPRSSASPLNLSGVVYSSIFNPSDHRKNWEDLLTGFLFALKNCEDATLVLKLITNQPRAVDEVWNFYHRTGILHQCKVVLAPDYLSDEQLVELAGATTYYITTTRAEGNCLPLMNYLAAGRPALSPCHTAIADYFSRDIGFVVESHPEPAAFPQDSQLRKTTTWHRLVWTSLVEQIQKSYAVAKQDLATYRRLARNARAEMLGWASSQEVAPRLREALDLVGEAPSETLSVDVVPLRRMAA